ncbi:hydrophobic protein [Streptomyces atroolivaceus]|uniref:hydrophobic protein n=1 Tax=Streptomyces atroolivaceus TaxID=66869 RepID=UPI0037B076F8
MLPVVLVLLLVLVLSGAGFALEALWWTALIVLAARLLGRLVRPAGRGGRSGHCYRW